MEKIEIVSGPEIEEKEIPEEEKYTEVTWELNQTPEDKWDKEFEKLIKKELEKENVLFGPFKPKIIFTQLILTIVDEKNIEKQKEYYISNFIEKVNHILE
jgi:hypothetical protein